MLVIPLVLTFGEGFVSETVVVAFSDDYMVDQRQTAGLEGALKCPGLIDVFSAWKGMPGRMIVDQYDSRCLAFDCSSDYHTVIDYCRVFTTAAEAVFPQKQVCLVCVDSPTFFVPDIFQ